MLKRPYFANTFLWYDPLPDIPPWAQAAFSFFPSHIHCYCCFVSPLLFPVLLTNFFSFAHFASFAAFPIPLRHFSSCPFVPWFSTERLHPSSEFQCYWIVHCFQLLPPFGFPLSDSPHYYVPWSPCTCWFYHGVPLDYDTYPSPFFCYILLFITTCCTDFYSYVLRSTSIYFLSPFHALYSTIESSVSQLCTWYFYHAIAGLWLPPPIVLFYITYLLVN